MPIDLSKFIRRFIEEAREQMGRMTTGLASLTERDGNPENLNALFRAAHTLKGSARMLKLESVSQTAHHLEDMLGALREGRLAPTAQLQAMLYRGVDAITRLVDHLDDTQDPNSLPPADADLLAELARLAAGEAICGTDTDGPAPPVVTLSPAKAVVSPAPAATPAPPSPPASRANDDTFELKAVDSVRVRLTSLDHLNRLTGELMTWHTRLYRHLQELEQLTRHTVASPQARSLYMTLSQLTRQFRDHLQHGDSHITELQDHSLQLRLLPLAIVFEPAARMVRELTRAVGKQVACVIQGQTIELDRQLIDKLSDAMVHILRNAVDHGLETPAERTAAGKSAQGQITLRAFQDGAWVVIEIADDGAGIPLEKVRAKAIQKGLLTSEQLATASNQDLMNLIFAPGFSTSLIITDLSGRGVGMDVVRQCIVNELQGQISIASQPQVGTTFTLRLPISLAVMRVLLVMVNSQPFGFTAAQITALLRVASTDLLNVASRQVMLLHSEMIPILPLADLLTLTGIPEDQTPAADELLVVVVCAGAAKLALVVDALLDEGDMVIKPLPEHLQRYGLVSGMVTSSYCDLVSLLHVPALLTRAGRIQKGRTKVEAASASALLLGFPAAQPNLPAWKVLVVDDSLNTREITKDVLEAHGYRVTLAEDGQEALHKSRADRFDAILTDVEMPRMDGFTLTQTLRQTEAYATTPIIIITSREKETDKQRGMDAGADAYIVKRNFEQSNLVDTLQALLGQV